MWAGHGSRAEPGPAGSEFPAGSDSRPRKSLQCPALGAAGTEQGVSSQKPPGAFPWDPTDLRTLILPKKIQPNPWGAHEQRRSSRCGRQRQPGLFWTQLPLCSHSALISAPSSHPHPATHQQLRQLLSAKRQLHPGSPAEQKIEGKFAGFIKIRQLPENIHRREVQRNLHFWGAQHKSCISLQKNLNNLLRLQTAQCQ